MFRIAYICADLGIPVFGQKGCSIHVQEVIRSFLKLQGKIYLFTPRLGGEIPADLNGINMCQLSSIKNKKDTLEREKAALELNQEIITQLESYAPFDLVYERYSLWSYGAMEYAKNNHIPSILEVNSPLIEEQEKHRTLIGKDKALEIARRVFDLAQGIVTVSQPVKSYIQAYLDDGLDKVKVISNGVNPERFLPPMMDDKYYFTVGFVGTLKPWHGLPILLNCFDKLYQQNDRVRLLIVGDGPERQSLQEEITKKGLDSVVEMTGAVLPQQIPLLLQRMSVAVAPYPPMENFYFSPLKVYEYMAAGLPVVVSNLGELGDLVQDHVNGFLVDAGDVDGMVNCIQKLVRSPLLRQKISHNAYETIINHHTWDQVVIKTLKMVNLL